KYAGLGERPEVEHDAALALRRAIEADRITSLILHGPPGTGKTTTLLQLVEAILGNASSVALYVPLSEWSTRSDTFFQSLVRRAAFRGAKERQFEVLAEHGKLVLILDGWNELDEPSKRRARNGVKSLRRDFPDIRLVVSSRQKDFDIPIDGPVVEVDVLTEEQQLEIARALRGSEGESLMDHAWRTPGLRELVAIPLYLTALLKQVPGGSLPTTKEEVLGSFVTELEKDPDKLATLREALLGFHRDFLEAIAAKATREENVALSEAQARAVVNTVQERLKADKQIAELLQPMKVLDALVSAHMLVRPGAETGGVSFQHQQFQEWFASFWVEQLMLPAASGDNAAKKTLRENVLDIPVWEEAILFACDRLSRADQGSRQAVASAILETLGIDPLLSAEMIYRSSDEVWEEVRSNVMSFARKWHTEGSVDRAVHFMIDTGRAEFSQYIWPLISNPDNQVHLRALRSGYRFRPTVLGPDVQERIAALPEEVREHVVAEIASNGGMDGIELATLLAKNDSSSEVKKSVIESLLFRRADRFAKDILESAPDEVWRSLARKWHPNEFADPQVSARIEKEAAEILVVESDPRKVLNTLLSPNARDSETGPKIRELVEKIDFSEKSQDNAWLVNRAFELYPEDIVGALVSQLGSGKPLPFGTDELLLKSDVVIDEGPLVDCVLQNSGEGKTAETAVSIVGPRTVGRLVNQMFEIYAKIKANKGKYDQALSNEYHRLSQWISKTKSSSFIQAILELADTEKSDEIAVLADLIPRHGRSGEQGPLRLDSIAHGNMTAAV
ncbi:MAG: NACHT domain-containing protein, partial [Planctomycetes bacterium]|nr:NACHT domain-containing protein [Planctomycetota bacterium]